MYISLIKPKRKVVQELVEDWGILTPSVREIESLPTPVLYSTVELSEDDRLERAIVRVTSKLKEWYEVGDEVWVTVDPDAKLYVHSIDVDDVIGVMSMDLRRCGDATGYDREHGMLYLRDIIPEGAHA